MDSPEILYSQVPFMELLYNNIEAVALSKYSILLPQCFKYKMEEMNGRYIQTGICKYNKEVVITFGLVICNDIPRIIHIPLKLSVEISHDLKQQEDFMRINPDPTPYDFGYNQLFQLEPNIIDNIINNNPITPLTIKL